MAKLTIASARNAAAEFIGGGRVSASITKLPRGKFSFSILIPALADVDLRTLEDYADAIRKVCKHVGKVIGKQVSIGGSKVDPDEPALDDLTRDLTVTYQIFLKDPRYQLAFTRYVFNGFVGARVPSFAFTDIPSAIQVAHVAMKASTLMRSYVELG